MAKKALILANTGGFCSFLLQDMDLLREKGYQVTVAANGKNHNWEDTREKLERRGLTLRQIDFNGRSPLAKENLQAAKQLQALLKEDHYDLIHCHTPVVGLVTRLLTGKARRRGTKVLYTTHGFAFTRYSSRKERLIYRTIEMLGAHRGDGIITINREDFEAAGELGGGKVFYIPGVGLDIEKYSQIEIDRQAMRCDLGITDDQILVLSVGEICPRKNHGILIDAIARLPDKERYVLMICGSGEHTQLGQQLRQSAQNQGVKLMLMGFRRDIPQLTHCSDIGAIPSLREGLGMAGLQSLCAGVPLAGSRIQGICDYIEEGKTGFLCHPQKAEDFAAAIEKLSDPALRESMAPACRETATKFRKELSRAHMETIYGMTLGWSRQEETKHEG